MGERHRTAVTRSKAARYVYPAVAALLFALMLVGFQQFYLHGKAVGGRELAAPIRLLVVTHGVLMTGWILLFLAQTLLVATGNRRIHMKLGVAGAVLAAGIVLLGVYVPIAATRFEPPHELWGLDRIHFMAVPMLSILAFGAFVAVGIWKRRRPEIHRPMMLMATLSIMMAATDRIVGVRSLYASTLWGRMFGPYFVPLVIGALVLVVRCTLTRSFGRWLAASYAALVLVSFFIFQLAHTRAWELFATFLVR